MNEIKIFENEEFGKVRTIEINNRPYFCAIDVAKSLGYKNTRDAILRHCKWIVKHDGVSNTTNQHGVTTEQSNEMSFIPEGDVYRLIIKSKLPNAQKFESWVMDKVLPQIRKTGGYIPVKEEDSEAEIMAKALLIANKTIAAKDEIIETQKKEIDEMRPKADFVDHITASSSTIDMNEFSKIMNDHNVCMGRNKLMEWMRKHKYFMKNNTPYQRYMNCGYFEVTESFKNGMVVSTNQVANFFDCGHEAVKTIIKRNREEFEDDGMVVLKGEELKSFKEKIGQVQIEPNLNFAPSLTILTKRSLLRVGMILTNNAMATKIRNYLLNIEETTEIDRKSWAIQREVVIIERKRMTSAIAKYLPNNKNKKFAYPNYTNMVYKVIFGKEAKELREERKVKTNDALRDSFSEKELNFVEEVETIVTGLISMDFTYKQIEEMLYKKYKK